MLFSAAVSFSFEVLAVSEGAAGVLAEEPWEDLLGVSVFDSESPSCCGAVAAGEGESCVN